MFRIATVIISLMLMTFNASSDVLSRKDSGVVHVVTNQDQTVSFYYCKSADPATCKTLGPKDRYTLQEVQFVRAKLAAQARRSVASDLTHFALSAGVAALTAVLTGANPTLGAVTIKALLAAAGSTVVIVKSYIFPDGNNPRLKYRVVKAISSKVLGGGNMYVREPAEEFAKRLDEALKTLLKAPARIAGALNA